MSYLVIDRQNINNKNLQTKLKGVYEVVEYNNERYMLYTLTPPAPLDDIKDLGRKIVGKDFKKIQPLVKPSVKQSVVEPVKKPKAEPKVEPKVEPEEPKEEKLSEEEEEELRQLEEENVSKKLVNKKRAYDGITKLKDYTYDNVNVLVRSIEKYKDKYTPAEMRKLEGILSTRGDMVKNLRRERNTKAMNVNRALVRGLLGDMGNLRQYFSSEIRRGVVYEPKKKKN